MFIDNLRPKIETKLLNLDPRNRPMELEQLYCDAFRNATPGSATFSLSQSRHTSFRAF
jgi:hypothetical protein